MATEVLQEEEKIFSGEENGDEATEGKDYEEDKPRKETTTNISL
jgi:hypothetical protein